MPGTFGDANTARLHHLMADSEATPEPDAGAEPTALPVQEPGPVVSVVPATSTTVAAVPPAAG